MFRILTVCLLPALAVAQVDKAAPRFEVCDIQSSKITDPRQMKADFLPGGRLDVRGISMKMMLAYLFNVQENMVEGPGWMGSEYYDIICKAPPNSNDDQLVAMAQTMLAERFKLVAHTEKKPAPVWALVANKKGVKITEVSAPGQDPGRLHDVICPMAAPAPGRTEPPGWIHRECHGVTMADLARMIPQIAPAYFEGLPVVDLTELKGYYEFKLDWMARMAYNAAKDTSTSGGGDAVSIFDAVEKLGLRLEGRKYPMDMIVVDSIERMPVEN
jgi:uncharacterized protein (TIGR03435 family)